MEEEERLPFLSSGLFRGPVDLQAVRLLLWQKVLSQHSSLFPAHMRIAQIHDVLDIGCGPGGWVLDVVGHYPDLQAVGIDSTAEMIEIAALHAWVVAPRPQVQFRVVQQLSDLATAFPGRLFDVIRLCVTDKFELDWNAFLRTVHTLLRPGGYFYFLVTESMITTSQALSRFLALLTLARHQMNIPACPLAVCFTQQVEQANFSQIQHRSESVGISSETTILLEYITITIQLLRESTVQSTVITAPAFDQLSSQIIAEMKAPTFCGQLNLKTSWARKPEWSIS